MTENKKINPQLQKSLAQGKTVIGIDIAATSVNISQMAFYQGKPTIIKVAVENIGVTGEQERRVVIPEILKEALLGFDTRNADIICTVSNQKTLFDYITLPLMPEAEIYDAIKIEINSSQRFAVENPFFDYKVVGRILDRNIEKLLVRVAIVSQGVIDSLLSNFKPSENQELLGSLRKILKTQDFMGLNLVKIIPTSIALENIIKKSKLGDGETIVTLEIGSMSSEINIFKDGRLEFSRKINVTGSDLTKCLTTALSTTAGKVELTVQEAESVKREFGIPSASEEYLIKGKITANQVISLLRPKLEQVIKEVARSFDFYYDKNPTGKLDRLVLLGGGTMLKRLPEFLNVELGMPVGLDNSLENISFLDEEILNSFQGGRKLTMAIGASLSNVDGINLLPEQFRNSKKKFVQKILMGVAAIAVVLVSILFYIVLSAQLNGIQEESLKIGSEYQSLMPQIREIKDKLSVQNISNHRLDMGIVLRALSHAPKKVYLTDMDLTNGNFTLSGFVVAPSRDAKRILKALIGELKDTSLQDIKISSINEDPQYEDRSNFIINASFSSGGAGQ